MKICNKCKIEKENSDFNKLKSSPDGLSRQCKGCNKANLKNHYERNKAYYLLKNTKRRLETKEYVETVKIACTKCGEDHIACLDFHHNDPNEKSISIALAMNRGWSQKRLNIEMSKCTVLCANCHRKLHYEEKNSLVV